MTRRAPAALALAAVLATASCGITYVSPSVRSQSEETPVRVMAISSQSVMMANRTPYMPQSLPEAFYQTASNEGQMRQATALPDAPVVPDENFRDPVMRPPPPVEPEPKRDRQSQYSGEEDQETVRGTVSPTNAIQTCVTTKVLFGMALRQTTGFVESFLRLARLDWAVPDFSTARADARRPWQRLCGCRP